MSATVGQPTTLEFLPDGRLLVGSKDGMIYLVSGADYGTVTTYLQVPNVKSDQERGLQTIVLDPNFASNNRFYVYYTANSPARQRVSRFTHVNNSGGSTSTGNPASELLIWQAPVNYTSCCHHGGGMDIGPDGLLYLCVGDEYNGAFASDLTDYHGKLLRMTLTGGVPTDNGFYDGSGPNYDYIHAFGLRNPFRANWDAVYGQLYIGEVGGNDPFTARDDLHLGAGGVNFGWPNCEGNNCTWPSGQPADFSPPIYSYDHQVAPSYGGAIIGGPVYRGTMFPASFVGNIFIGDYVQNWIKLLTLDPTGTAVTGDMVFHSNAGAVVDIEEAPDGSLFYADLYSGVKRVIYTPGDQPPVCGTISVSPTAGQAPLGITCNAQVSDSENGPMTYSWNFSDGPPTNGNVPNGSGFRTVPTASHTYTTNGARNVQLMVSDGVHNVQCPATTVGVGTPPTATITAPIDGATFVAGAFIPYSGAGNDPNGTLTNASYTWEIVFLHDTHIHPEFGPASGFTSGTLDIPIDGHDFSGNTRYEIRLKVTDNEGLAAYDTVTVWPQKVNLTFNTVPAGLNVDIDGVVNTTPLVMSTLIGFHHYITVHPECIGPNQYGFQQWSDGGGQYHMVVVPSSNITYTATFAFWGACQNQVRVQPKVLLKGPFNAINNLMDDPLRSGGLVPLNEPYTALGFTLVGGGGESIAPAVLAVSGSDAILDWVVTELRDKDDPTIVVRSRCALLQRDGDVVDLNGTGPVAFTGNADQYYVAVRHRNHLGIMTATTRNLGSTPIPIDFTNVGTSVWGNNARAQVNSKMLMWSGNTVPDEVLKYTGSANDRDRILMRIGGTVPTATVDGYWIEDVNMNGTVKYAGSDNDRDPILVNIGGTTPTITRTEQLP